MREKTEETEIRSDRRLRGTEDRNKNKGIRVWVLRKSET